VIAHQIVLAIAPAPAWPDRGGHRIRVSCTCLAVRRSGRPGHETIEARTLFPAADVLAAWRAWHAERGVAV